MLLHEIFKSSAPDLIALKSGALSITYKDLNQTVQKYRSYFESIGMQSGENVGLFYKNAPEFIYAYFAVVALGAVVVPLNIMSTPSEIAYIAEDAKMKHLITMTKLELAPQYRQLVIPELETVIHSTGITEQEVIARAEEDVVVIIYTSGTTGFPKGAMLTHKNLCSNASCVADYLSMTTKDSVLCVLPMFHSFAWTVSILTSLMVGSTIVIMDAFLPKEVLQTIQGEQITIVSGVPAMYNYYLMVGTKEIFATVRLFISGGAALPVQVLENFKKKFDLKIFEGYGLSEASPVVSINPLDDTRAGSIGKALPGISVKIVDEHGNQLPNGEPGELLVMGPNVMKGYLNLPEVSSNTMAYIDDEGYIYIVDRIKDIVIVSGLNVYPREIEETLYQYDGVIEAAVIGVPDQKKGESLLAFIVVADGKPFNLSDLKKHLTDRTASFKLPRKIIVRESLPKNATGKIMKKLLKEEFSY